MIKFFDQIKRIIRTAQSGNPVGKHLTDLALLLEAEAELTKDRETLDQAKWLRRHAAAERNQQTQATPETIENLQAARLDPVEAMMRRGRLSEAEFGAIIRIRECFRALTQGIDVRNMPLDYIRVDTSTSAIRDPADRMSQRMALTIKYVFRPWAQRTGARVEILKKLGKGPEFAPLTPQERAIIKATGGTMDAPVPFEYTESYYRKYRREVDREVVVGRRIVGITTFELVRAVCVDGISTRALERYYHVGTGKLQPGLISGVREFGKLYEGARVAGLLNYLDY